METSELDALWAKHIGSSKLSSIDEMKALWRLQETQAISSRKIYLLFLRSKRWRAISLKVLHRDKFSCVKCGSRQLVSVDHIRYPKKLGDELLEDLQTLCWHCHNKKTRRYDMLATSSKGKMSLAKSKIQGQLFGLFRTVRWKRENVEGGVREENTGDIEFTKERAEQGSYQANG